MRDFVKSFYHRVVNYNQWWNYGKSWANVPLSILQYTSHVSVILLLLDVERQRIILLTMTGIIVSLISTVGYFMFKSGGEQIDRIMLNWRNTVHELATVGLWYADTLVAIELGIPVPDELYEFGVEEWEDLFKLYRFVLDKGKKAGALTLCRRYLGKEDLVVN